MNKSNACARADHDKSVVFGAYCQFDERVRFDLLIKEAKKNKNQTNARLMDLIANDTWGHHDRPDWVNQNGTVGIEDATVEDTNHYLDRHFGKRRKMMKRAFGQMSTSERSEILVPNDTDLAKKKVKSGKIDPFALHYSSNDTVNEMNSKRSIHNWKSAVKVALDKHHKLMDGLAYQQKVLFLYDVTAPYTIERAISRNSYEKFCPLKDAGFQKLFQGYPATIIWWLVNQMKIDTFNPKDLDLIEAETVDYKFVNPVYFNYQNMPL